MSIMRAREGKRNTKDGKKGRKIGKEIEGKQKSEGGDGWRGEMKGRDAGER